ncbi:MAG TPA: hypothetical protein VF092_16550 [Longimicrobium sp.]
MPFPRLPARAALALLPLLAAAACKDQTPTLTGDEFFPGGSRPVTLEAIIPAAQYLQTIGAFSGYENARTLSEQVVANQYQGVLSAHALQRFDFPDTLTYSQNGNSLTDTLYGVRSARLVVFVDSLGSQTTGTTTLQAFDLAQRYDALTVTWDSAFNTDSVHTLWTTPGGTTGPLLGQGTYNAAASDSVVINIDSVSAARIRPDSFPGILLAVNPGRRLQVVSSVLRLAARPSNAPRDTTITVEIAAAEPAFVFTPQPPVPAGSWLAGGVAAARTLFTVDLDQPLPGCPPTQTCATVSLKDVELNRVSILLKPLPPPAGFDPLSPVTLTLWTVDEPALGRRAPLLQLALDADRPENSFVNHAPADTVVELPITLLARQAAADDSLQRSFALLGQTPPVQGLSFRTFGMVRYDPLPRLRIVYTLPTRPQLP